MTRYRIYLYSAASVLGIASIFYCLLQFMPYLYRADSYQIVFDTNVSPLYVELVTSDIKKMNGQSPASLFNYLQKKYLFLKSMTARYEVDGSLTMEFASFHPLLNIRKEQVKLENGKNVPASVFTQESLDNISLCTVCANDKLGALSDQNFIACIDKIPDNLTRQYNILFTDAYDINLQDHEKTYFLIRSSVDKLNDDTLYVQCEKIKKSFCHAGLLSPSDKTFWIADVRFDNQIVLYQQKEELWYGS